MKTDTVRFLVIVFAWVFLSGGVTIRAEGEEGAEPAVEPAPAEEAAPVAVTEEAPTEKVEPVAGDEAKPAVAEEAPAPVENVAPAATEEVAAPVEATAPVAVTEETPAEKVEPAAETAPEPEPQEAPAVTEKAPAAEPAPASAAEKVPEVVVEKVPAPAPAKIENVPAPVPVVNVAKEAKADLGKSSAVMRLLQKKETKLVEANKEIARLQDAVKQNASAAKQLADAKKEVARLQDIVQRITDVNKREMTSMHNAMGLTAKTTGDLKKAEAELLEAARVDPSDAVTQYNLGVLYDVDLKNKKKAKIYYENYLQLAPNGKEKAKVQESLKSL